MKNDKLIVQKILLLIICIFIFFTMYYYDNQTAFVSIIENMHRIVNGEWYYIFNGWSAIPYGLLLQGMCAIWALPVLILSELSIIVPTCVGARLWFKLFILIFLVLDVIQLQKLAAKMPGLLLKKKEWVSLYFLSSLLVMLPAVHIAQMDAISLFFILLGLNFYLEDKHFPFLLCFMIAIPGKYLPLFIFIPLILLKEKRYLYIIRDLSVGCILILVDRAMKSIGYRIENSIGVDINEVISYNETIDHTINKLLTSEFIVFEAPMSIVLAAFMVLCIWCYLKESKHKNDLAVYVSFIGFSLVFAFGEATAYWIILLVPFQLLLILKNPKHYNILFPMEVMFMVSYVYVFIFRTSWIFGSENTFSFLLFSLIPEYNNQIHGFISDFLKLKGLDIFSGAMSAILFAVTIGIIYITYPLKKEENSDNMTDNIYIKGWYWVRIAVMYAWVFLNIWVVALNKF